MAKLDTVVGATSRFRGVRLRFNHQRETWAQPARGFGTTSKRRRYNQREASFQPARGFARSQWLSDVAFARTTKSRQAMPGRLQSPR